MVFQLFIASILLLHLAPIDCAQIADLAAPAKYKPQEYSRTCPLPKCESCPSVEDLRAPGVGFALETSHGASVVRLHDGTLHDIALVEGDASYTALMRRLATGPKNRTPEHFDTNWEKLKYLQSRARRLSNKLVGRPATPETAVLAQMVSKLLRATKTWLGDGQAVVAAVLSSPDRVNLSDEEIGDVFDYLKLQNLMDGQLSLYQLYAASAAYAGYGKGLCHTYTDAYTCEREDFEFPDQRVLQVDFNTETLSGTIKSLRSANDGSLDATFVDPDLGQGRDGGENDQEYWTAVSNRIRELVKNLSDRVYMPHVTELLLTGPSATNERFQAAIRAALQGCIADEDVLAVLEDSSQANSNQEEWQSLFSFATARGAAEVAKRKQEGPVNCAQSDACRRKREEVHGEGQKTLLKQQPQHNELR